jgi:hypothetical protein
MTSERLLNLTKCAYAVDEVIDHLIRWDGEDLDTIGVIQEVLDDAREAIFADARPELIMLWRAKEAAIRGMEDDPEFSPWGNDEYQVLRDEREALFQKICEEARTS